MALKLPLDAFRSGELRPHLFMNFRLTDEHGGTLAISRNLAELRAEYRGRVEQVYAAAEVQHEAAGSDSSGATAWTFGALPELMEVKVGAGTTLGFPALVDMGESVRLAAFDTEDKARAEHRRGMARLFALQLAAQVKAIEKLPGLRETALQFISLGTEKELREQLVAVTLERTCLMDPLPTEESAFATRREAARGRILLVAQEILRLLGIILAEHALLAKKLAAMQKAFPQACADIGAQLAELMPKKFIAITPFERLQHYPRYLKAITLRLEKARSDPARDARLMADWQALGKPWERERNAMLKSGQAGDAFLDEFRWLLEELRVALFAQELKTSSPVSVKRLQKMWEARLHK
jgi:ATP-dependent helicase HrpA